MTAQPARIPFRKHVVIVSAVSVTMLAVTALSCWHAYWKTGNVLFLNTQMEVNAYRPPPVSSIEDAEWDDAMRDAGGTVEQLQPVFMPIIGLLDVTLPVICLGAAWLGVVAIRGLRRNSANAERGTRKSEQ